MNISLLTATGLAVLEARLLKSHIPLTVSWALTHRCNARCLYCGIPQQPMPEMTTFEIRRLMDELVVLGLRFVSFTGGEPLLRDDIGEIITHAVSKGLQTSLSTNGLLVKEKFAQIHKIKRITLSLDGPEEVHERTRNLGTHRRVLEALSLTTQAGIKTLLNTVLSKHNLQSVEYILAVARKHKVSVFFQPTTVQLLGMHAPNLEIPPEDEYRQIIANLIRKKKQGEAAIANSVAGLSHLLRWPQQTNIPCVAGRLHFRIEPNGDMNICYRKYAVGSEPERNVRAGGAAGAIAGLTPRPCSGCWCAPFVELNLATAMNFSAITNMISQV